MREPAFWHAPNSWTSHLLRPLGALYGAVAAQRLQGKGLDAGIPVFCVGNYHVGGAGKTPAVLALARILRELGETPVVLSRGYGGRLRGPVVVASPVDNGRVSACVRTRTGTTANPAFGPRSTTSARGTYAGWCTNP